VQSLLERLYPGLVPPETHRPAYAAWSHFTGRAISFLQPLEFTSFDIVLVVEPRLALSLFVLCNRSLEETPQDSRLSFPRSADLASAENFLCFLLERSLEFILQHASTLPASYIARLQRAQEHDEINDRIGRDDSL
jgi:hypothetical protein